MNMKYFHKTITMNNILREVDTRQNINLLRSVWLFLLNNETSVTAQTFDFKTS